MDVYLVSALSGFAGVIIGGVVTFFTARWIETQKWQQQKADRRLADLRDALKSAMDWLGPINRAVGKVSTFAELYKVRRPGQDPRDAYSEWPNLSAELEEMQLHPASLALLPSEISDGAKPIIEAIDVLELLSWSRTEELEALRVPLQSVTKEYMDEHKRAFEQSSRGFFAQLNKLLEIADKYRGRLEAEYRATYD